MEAVRREQERHVTILHRNFHNLQSSLESSHQAAANKVANHLSDNQTLLNEVNNLRMEVINILCKDSYDCYFPFFVASQVKSLSLENHRLSAQLEYQATKHATELHNMQSLVLNSETDERYTSNKRKSVPQTQPQTADFPKPTTLLPKIHQSSAVNNVFEPSMDDSVNTNMDESQAESIGRKKINSKKSSKQVLSIEELLNTHTGGMARSRSDFAPMKKDHVLSQSAPLLALGNSISTTTNQSMASVDQRVSSADKKIAAIIELNLQELKSNKKNNKTQF